MCVEYEGIKRALNTCTRGINATHDRIVVYIDGIGDVLDICSCTGPINCPEDLLIITNKGVIARIATSRETVSIVSYPIELHSIDATSTSTSYWWYTHVVDLINSVIIQHIPYNGDTIPVLAIGNNCNVGGKNFSIGAL